MATTPVRQSSFDGGEIAPDLYGRTDSPRYSRSLRRMVNCFSGVGGAAKNRAGTRYGGATKSNAGVWTVPFVFSSTQAYVLEFGNLYVRFLSAGGLVLSSGVPYEVVTPFTTAMLPYLRWAQVGDVLTVCYGGQGVPAALAPRELKRLGHTSWQLSTVGFSATFNSFSTLPALVTPGPVPDATHGGSQWDWRITQLWRENTTGNVIETYTGGGGALSQLPGYSGATTYAAGDLVSASDGSGNAIVYTSLVAVNTGHTPDSSPTWWARGVSMDTDRTQKIKWVDGTLAGYTLVGHEIYRGRPRSPTLSDGPTTFGWVGFAEGSSQQFLDEGTAPDYTHQPPQSTDPFASPVGDWPAAVGFFEQRRIFARQAAHPQRIQGSRPNAYSNFDVSLFVQDADALAFDLASDQFDEIRHLVPHRELLALTQSGLYAIRGFQGDPLSPSSVDAKKHSSSIGASWVPPAKTGSSSFAYVPEGQSGIVEASFDYNINLWLVNDLTVPASHLFNGHTIIQIAFASRPSKILWAVRDDGVLLGMTRAGDVLAWHRHTTDGAVENVCVIPEGTEDAVYLVVRRTVNGATVRYHERMASRLVTDLRLGAFLDASIQFDGRNVLATTMKFTSDSGVYGGGEEGTILASVASFVGATDIGDQIVFDPDALAGGPFRLTIIDYTDPTHARAQLDQPLAAAFRNIASASWAFARDAITGLDHLEGKSVMVLADGDTQGPYTVNGGSIVLVPPAVIAQIGLKYQPLLELLDVPEDGKQKTVQAVTLKLSESRGVKAGESENNLFEWDSQRTVEVGYGPIPMFTGQVKIRIQDSVGVDGRCVVVQDEPLPMTITGIKRELSVGGEL